MVIVASLDLDLPEGLRDLMDEFVAQLVNHGDEHDFAPPVDLVNRLVAGGPDTRAYLESLADSLKSMCGSTSGL